MQNALFPMHCSQQPRGEHISGTGIKVVGMSASELWKLCQMIQLNSVARENPDFRRRNRIKIVPVEELSLN